MGEVPLFKHPEVTGRDTWVARIKNLRTHTGFGVSASWVELQRVD